MIFLIQDQDYKVVPYLPDIIFMSPFPLPKFLVLSAAAQPLI